MSLNLEKLVHSASMMAFQFHAFWGGSMTAINVNSISNEGLPTPFVDFRGVDQSASQRLTTLLRDRPPVEDTSTLTEYFAEAGIEPTFHDGLLAWFYGYDDPCDCWRRVNINDLRYDETAAMFSVLDGIDATTAELIQKIRSTQPRPTGFDEFSGQLLDAGVPAPIVERLSVWMDAEINDVTNMANDAECIAALAEVPVLVAVSPTEAAPGDTIKLDVRNLQKSSRTWVEINGYPAETLRFDVSENLIECQVPDEVADNATIEIFLSGMPGPVAGDLTILPKIIQQDCPESIDTRVIALGTTASVLIDVERTNPLTDELFSETLQTEYFCGTNSVVLRGGAMNAPVPINYTMTGVLSPTLYGLISSTSVLAAMNVVQLIGRKEKDASGKERVVYYFFRDGKWWRIRDPESKHPEDPNAIDVRDDIPDKNFTEADATTTEELREKFFPTGWEENWREFEESQRVQMQLMWAIGWQMGGGDAESAKLVFDIKKGLDAGKSWDEILGEHWRTILYSVIFGVALGSAGKLLRVLKRFFRYMFPKLIERITRIVKNGDDITITTTPETWVGNTSGKLGKKVGGKGITARVTGRIDRGRNVLYCTPTDTPWENATGRRGFARDLFENWLEKLKKFAREKKVGNVEIDVETISEEGAKMARELNFVKVSEKTVGGVTRAKWTRIYPVD